MHKTKIGIVTHYGNHNHNVGALLQALALQVTVSEMGYECDVVDTCINYIAENRRRKTIYYVWKRVRRILGQRPSALFHKIRARLSADKGKFQILSHADMKKRCGLFSEFEAYIPHSKKYTEKTISDANAVYDGYITGSDVVFANGLYNRDPYWLLSFAGNKLKMSYAASMEDWFQEDDLTKWDMRFLKKYLSDFRGVSLRESGTAERFCLFGVHAVHVLDPVLLRSTDFYDALARPAEIPGYHGEPFALCYFVKETGYVKAKISDYCNRNGLRMVLLPHLQGAFSVEDEKYRDAHVFAGPREFLWLLKNARIVFGSSYHGICLSLLYHKQFAAFQPRFLQMKNDNDFDTRIRRTRIGSLLSLVGLLDRCFDMDDFPNDAFLSRPIAYQTVDRILDEKRKDSMQFLENTLREAGI